jgi:hypothetical protein
MEGTFLMNKKTFICLVSFCSVCFLGNASAELNEGTFLDPSSNLETLPGGSILTVNQDITPMKGSSQIFLQRGLVVDGGSIDTKSSMCELEHRGALSSGTNLVISTVDEDNAKDPSHALHYRTPRLNGMWLEVVMGIRTAPNDLAWLVCLVPLPKKNVAIGDFQDAAGNILTILPSPTNPK